MSITFLVSSLRALFTRLDTNAAGRTIGVGGSFNHGGRGEYVCAAGGKTTLTYPVSQISYIWPSRWTVMKSIYLVNRYSPFIDTSLSLSGKS